MTNPNHRQEPGPMPGPSGGPAPVGGWIPAHSGFDPVWQLPSLIFTVEEGYEGLATAPSRAHQTDIGLDLYVAGQSPVSIYPGQWLDVRHGIHVQLPAGYWGLVMPRSSTIRKRGLIVHPGIIDPDYRGPLFTLVQNINFGINAQPTVIEPGDRISQLLLIPVERATSVIVKEVQAGDFDRNTSRGEGGFGSTGQ